MAKRHDKYMDSLIFRDGDYSIYRSVFNGKAYFTARYEHRLLTSQSEEIARLACVKHKNAKKERKYPLKPIILIALFELGFLIVFLIDKIRGLWLHPACTPIVRIKYECFVVAVLPLVLGIKAYREVDKWHGRIMWVCYAD